jgi:pyrroline-5-carboxylate reductase
MRAMHLAADYATPGGLNEQVLRNFTSHQVFDLLTASLDRVRLRIT